MGTKTGGYRHRVNIQGPVIGEDAIGNQIDMFGTVGEAWANIEPLAGREYYLAAQTLPETTHKITMRPPGFTILKEFELVYGTRRFGIESVIDKGERHNELVLMCKEKA